MKVKLHDSELPAPKPNVIKAPVRPAPVTQLSEDAAERRDRSIRLVKAAIGHLKATSHISRSPGKNAIAEASRLPHIDEERRGVTTEVFRTNQACLDLYRDACLPFDAARRKSVAAPSWAVRLDHDKLIDLVISTEADEDQLTNELMAASERLLQMEVARIRRETVAAITRRMVAEVES
ncbi:MULTISPECIES: hypothetical protein [Sphingomonas]|uniref:hypothetical protein n=1 Tax=Sphingomonas TaxID=13687 RepID=UPI002FE1B80F